MSGILLAAVLALAAGPEVQVQTLSGETIAGPLAGWTAEQIEIETPGGPRSVPLEQVTAISPAAAPDAIEARPGAWIELVDGSRLVAEGYLVREGQAAITLLWGGEVTIPTRAIRTVRFKEQTDEIAAQWAEVLAADAAGDLIVVRKGDAIDYLEGELGDIDAENVQFTLEGDVVPVKRPRVEGFVYFHAAAEELPGAVCRVSDAAGGEYSARELSLADGRLKLVTPAGVEIDRPWEQISQLDFSQGKIQYLSDLEPESVEWTSYVGLSRQSPLVERFFHPRQDQGLDGDPLSLAGQVYAKGLCVHSRTRLVYRLPGKFSRFVATLGIDDSLEGHGSVRLVIEGDARRLLEETITGQDPPRAVELDVTGVKRLTIFVDFGPDQDIGDHLDLCDARIIQ